MTARPSPAAGAAAAAAAAGSDESALTFEGECGELLGYLQAFTPGAGNPTSVGRHALLEGASTLVTDEFVDWHLISPRDQGPPS